MGVRFIVIESGFGRSWRSSGNWLQIKLRWSHQVQSHRIPPAVSNGLVSKRDTFAATYLLVHPRYCKL